MADQNENNLDASLLPTHRVFLRWAPDRNKSPVFKEIGVAWDHLNYGDISLRFIVLSNVINAILAVGSNDKELDAQLLMYLAHDQDGPHSHIVKINNVVIGLGWQQRLILEL